MSTTTIDQVDEKEFNDATRERFLTYVSLPNNPGPIGKVTRSLTESDKLYVEAFIIGASDLTDDQFIEKANRLFIDEKEKPKNWKNIADVVSNIVVRKTVRVRRD